jgi:hypothetical protein
METKMAKLYEYRVINCHEIRQQTGIHGKEELIDWILNKAELLNTNGGWRLHSIVASDAFGIKGDCPLIILERGK